MDALLGPTPEAMNHGVVRETTEGNKGIQFVRLQFPLDYYFRRNQLEHPKEELRGRRRYDAGNKLYGLWYYGVAAGYRLMVYGEKMPSEEFKNYGLAAHHYRQALESIRGENERKVAYWVCCEGELAGQVKGFKSKRSAQRHGMDYLRSALDDLVSHFGV